jgi:beta-xylosidase
VDYKTKWSEYDLRISIHGDDKMNWMADAIETKYYREGRREYLIERLKELKPEVKGYQFWNLRDLEDEHDLITKNY